MARLPRYMKLTYAGTHQRPDGRWVADYDLGIAWWGWPFLLLWRLFHSHGQGVEEQLAIDAVAAIGAVLETAGVTDEIAEDPYR